MRIRYTAVIVAALAFAVPGLFRASAVSPSSRFADVPAVASPDPATAINNPQVRAWTLFLQLNRPGDLTPGHDRGLPDMSKKIGDPGCAVWETWRLARTEVFLPNGKAPPDWNDTGLDGPPCRTLRLEPSNIFQIATNNFDKPRGPSLEKVRALLSASSQRMLFDPVTPRNETRMNRATYDFIRDNELYSVDGQEVVFDRVSQGGVPLSFRVDSMEVKAAWRQLTAKELSDGTVNRYHTATANGKTFGLTGLHIISKDIPNWFWASFHQRETPLPPDMPALPPTMPAPDELKNTKWGNYVLTGVQVDFTTPGGQPVIVGDPVIEAGFERHSSCMTCHANASIAKDGTRADFGPFPNFDICQPNAAKFLAEDGTRKFVQLDFVWSLFRATRKQPPLDTLHFAPKGKPKGGARALAPKELLPPPRFCTDK